MIDSKAQGPARPHATLDVLPNLVLIGVTKCGTTSLFRYLGQHPQVCRAAVKQVNYFAPLRYGREPQAPLAAYAAPFVHWDGEPYRFDASPTYFYGGPQMVRAVAERLPDPRILVILREPVARLWSSYRYKQSKQRLPAGSDLQSFLDTCFRLRAGGQDALEEHSGYRTLSVGRYADHLALWAERFGQSLRVVFFEHLVDDPARETASIARWLGIDPACCEQLDYAGSNRTHHPRSFVMRALAKGVNRQLHSLDSRPSLKRALRSAYDRLNSRDLAESMSADQRERLRAYYFDANDALGRLLPGVARSETAPPPWVGGEIS